MAKEFWEGRITAIAEEPINTWFNRPQAGLFVRFFYRHTKVSANQVTLMAILAGILAGVLFGLGTRLAIFWGGLAYQLSIVFDCADGQLARLKGTSSEFGRILDGISDYIVGIAILVGALIGIENNYETYDLIIRMDKGAILPFALLGFIFLTIHSMVYDFVKTKFTSIIKTGTDQTVKERRELETRYQTQGASLSGGQRLMLRLYIRYNKLQSLLLSVKAYSKLNYSLSERKAILEKERGLLILWSFLGPNTHLVFIVIAALLGDPFFALWVAVIPFNIYYLFVILLTKLRLGRD